MSLIKEQLQEAGESNWKNVYDDFYISPGVEGNKITISDGGKCTSVLNYSIQKNQKMEFKFSVWNRTDWDNKNCEVDEFGIGLTTEPDEIDLLEYPKKLGVVHHTGTHEFFRNLDFSNMRSFSLPKTKVFEYDIDGSIVNSYSLDKAGSLGKKDKCRLTVDLTTDEDNVCIILGNNVNMLTVPTNETYYIWLHQGSNKDCTHNIELLSFIYN